MSGETVFVTLQQFCNEDEQPRKELLQAGFRIRENSLGRRLRREELPELLCEADAVLAGVEPYDGEILERLPRLRCISRCGVGTDSIDLEAAQRRGIVILTTPEEVIEPVVQMSLAMILALARNFPRHLHDFQKGRWEKHAGHLLSEWTIGLVGFGKIGSALYRVLLPFGCRILVFDPQLSPKEMPEVVRCADLRSLLKEADLVSLHAALPVGAPPLLGKQELAWMKSGGRIVNTARGRLIDEGALVEALRSGHLSGAALDVFENEPAAGELTRLSQVLCTPHVASLTTRSRARMELRCARNVVEFFHA